jgi:CMP-N-acetylneuraminic acid synthetase/spore coat polysaccharide biosynthesis predicted glycosyltransferase SpsG
MKGSLRVVAVIPARGGYDEVPYLNIKKLGPLPLVTHTLRQAARSRYVDRTVVSTDDEQVAEVAREFGADVPFRRPSELSGPIPSLKPVVAHAIEFLEKSEGEKVDLVVLLQATSPFRTAEQIDAALDKLVDEDLDSVISLSEEKALTWRIVDGKLTHVFGKEGLREDMEALYREDGAIRAMRRSVLDMPELYGERVGYVVMDKESAITVHDIYDFWLAEKLVRLPRILFRVDGGVSMGMGHVYRSLAIADEIRAVSPAADIQFLMKADRAEAIHGVSSAGYPVRILSRDAPEWLVKEIREYSPNIIVNDYPTPMRRDYLEALATVEASTINLTGGIEDIDKPTVMASVIIAAIHDDQLELEDFDGGPAFTILRESFAGRIHEIREHGRRVVVSFGQSDPQGLTLKVLSALDGLQDEIADLTVHVVLGPAYGYRLELERLLARLTLPPFISQSTHNMAETFFESDLVFCSDNLTVFEIAVLGTPGVVLSQNVRQGRRMETFGRRGSIVHLGLAPEVEEALIRETARELLGSAERRRRMSDAGRSLWKG